MIKHYIELRVDIEMYLPSDDNLTNIILSSEDWAKLTAVANNVYDKDQEEPLDEENVEEYESLT